LLDVIIVDECNGFRVFRYTLKYNFFNLEVYLFKEILMHYQPFRKSEKLRFKDYLKAKLKEFLV